MLEYINLIVEKTSEKKTVSLLNDHQSSSCTCCCCCMCRCFCYCICCRCCTRQIRTPHDTTVDCWIGMLCRSSCEEKRLLNKAELQTASNLKGCPDAPELWWLEALAAPLSKECSPQIGWVSWGKQPGWGNTCSDTFGLFLAWILCSSIIYV